MARKKDKEEIITWEKLTPVEQALLTLARYLEDPGHYNYKVSDQIEEILGLEFIPHEPRKRT